MSCGIHRVGDARACGAVTVDTGINTKVKVDNQFAAVAGMLDSHTLLGALVSVSPGTILVQGIPIIVAMLDQSAPDVIGIVQHVTNFPTPMVGSQKVRAYNLGSFGGGLGNILQGFGNLNVGELVSLGGQIIGQVHNFTNVGGNSGLAVLKNLQGAGLTNISGQTIVGQTSGNKFLMGSYQVDLPISNFNAIYNESGDAVVLESGDTVTL